MKKIVSTRKQAAALKYDPARHDAPVITAIGQGFIAEKIIESADQNNVPVIENTGLSEVLQKFSAGDAIPPKLYEAVARLFAFIYKMDQNYQNK